MKPVFPLKFFICPSFPVLFPFLTPIYEMLNVTRYPKDSIEFLKKFVDRMKENRMKSGEKVKSGWLPRGEGFVICWDVDM